MSPNNLSIQTTPAAKEFHAKAKTGGMNREARRKFVADLQREATRATMPDMAKSLRAKRQAKRQQANKSRNKNRRLNK